MSLLSRDEDISVEANKVSLKGDFGTNRTILVRRNVLPDFGLYKNNVVTKANTFSPIAIAGVSANTTLSAPVGALIACVGYTPVSSFSDSFTTIDPFKGFLTQFNPIEGKSILELCRGGGFVQLVPLDESRLHTCQLLESERTIDASHSLGSISPGLTEIVSTAAEEQAKKLGIYSSVVIAMSILKDKMASSISSLYVDFKKDPEDDGIGTIRLNSTLRASVDQALTLDDSVQEELVRRIPAEERVHISFNYDFI